MKKEFAIDPLPSPSTVAGSPETRPGRGSRRWLGLLIWGVVVTLIIAATFSWIHRVQSAAPDHKLL